MKVKNESELAQSCLTLSDPIDCSRPGSSVHGNFQARVLEWVAIAISVELLEVKYIYLQSSSTTLNSYNIPCVSYFLYLTDAWYQGLQSIKFSQSHYCFNIFFSNAVDIISIGNLDYFYKIFAQVICPFLLFFFLYKYLYVLFVYLCRCAC